MWVIEQGGGPRNAEDVKLTEEEYQAKIKEREDAKKAAEEEAKKSAEADAASETPAEDAQAPADAGGIRRRRLEAVCTAEDTYCGAENTCIKRVITAVADPALQAYVDALAADPKLA